MSCIKCKKGNSTYVNNYRCVPFETQAERMSNVLVFFQYRAPTITSSLSIPKAKEECIEVFNSFIYEESIDTLFIGQSAKISKHLTKYNISGNHICLKCSRFVCKRKNPKDGIKEEDYESFLRHMRNSIAHGNVYGLFTCNNSYLVFDDYSDGHSLTARIIITRAQLERLKRRITYIGV